MLNKGLVYNNHGRVQTEFKQFRATKKEITKRVAGPVQYMGSIVSYQSVMLGLLGVFSRSAGTLLIVKNI